MNCEDARNRLHAYVDQELEPREEQLVHRHLETCARCAAEELALHRLKQRLEGLASESAPNELVQRVRRRLRETSRADTHTQLRSLGRIAALVVLSCALSAAATAFFISRASNTESVVRELTAAHVRSLLQPEPAQLASSNPHVLKPWFSGHIDFVPSVRDLTAEGYPLVGARLDYVQEQPVPAFVFRRREHLINVFAWPISADGHRVVTRSRRGYQLISWTDADLQYWAISDLNQRELAAIPGLLHTSADE